MITCIHGFLGRPADWDFLRPEFEVEALSLDEAASLAARGARGEVLLGYSMGGRLALEALAAGARFERAVIVSAGLNLETGREERRAADERWARRFERDDWRAVVRDWNAQPVFRGHALERREDDFDRALLARALRMFSPAVLPPLAPRLPEIRLPVLWIAGERDERYAEVAKHAVALLPDAELWICRDAGHRVPWEQPEMFAERLREFVGDVGRQPVA